MSNIAVRAPMGRRLFNQFVALVNTLRDFSLSGGTQFDFAGCKFMHPLVVLPIAALIEERGIKFLPPRDSSVRAYASTIGFPVGRTSLYPQQSNSYIPICRLSKSRPLERSILEDRFVDTILHVYKNPNLGKDLIAYPVAEIVSNVVEHSRAENAWIFAQHYPKLKYVDVCIADLGRGIRRSLLEDRHVTYADDLAAIEAALKGISAKNDIERGFGLHTTKNLVFNGMKGEFFLCSGSAVVISSNGNDYSTMVNGFNWDGVIVAFRIPHITQPVDLYHYVC